MVSDAEGLPEVGGEGDVFEVDCVAEERGDLLGGEAGDAAADSGNEEAEFGVAVGKDDEAVYCVVEFEEGAHGGDSVRLSLESFALSPHGTEAVHGLTCGASAVATGGVAAEYEDFVIVQRGYVVRCYSGRVVFFGEGLFAEADFIVGELFAIHCVHLFIVGMARGTFAMPCVFGSELIMREFHHVFYFEQVGNFFDVVGGSHVGEGPAFFFELSDESFEGRGSPFL